MEPDVEAVSEISLDKRAYRFFPRREEEKSAFEKKGTRFFFYGQIEHDEYELRKLRQFHEYVAKKEKKYNKALYDNEHLILQFLSANKYKPKQTLKAMNEHDKFVNEYLPTINLQKIEPVLKAGFYYPCGRDKYFRPLLVFRIKMMDPKNIDLYFDSIVTAQEIVKKKMFIPGQVQSWNLIYDLAGIGISDIPLTALKDVLGRISLNYGGRLNKLWIVNAPSGVSTTWKIVSTFLDPVTVDKIKISKTNTQTSIFDYHHPSQVEAKYGGAKPDQKQFYPFKLPPGVFDQTRLLSDIQYEKLLKEGKLVRNVIDPKFAEIKE